MGFSSGGLPSGVSCVSLTGKPNRELAVASLIQKRDQSSNIVYTMISETVMHCCGSHKSCDGLAFGGGVAMTAAGTCTDGASLSMRPEAASWW